MRQQITAEIDAPRRNVWAALAGELEARGPHVEIVRQRTPEELTLRLRAAPGEQQLLHYELVELDETHTAVTASIAPSGPLYVFKWLFSFGIVDRHYLDAIAVGLANLQRHVGSDDAQGDTRNA